MNIIIPMGGKGQRFIDAGYKEPKPFIDVCGKPMLQVALENLNIDGRYTFIVRPEDHDRTVEIAHRVLGENYGVIVLNEPVKGAVPACLALEIGMQHTCDPLVIANCDQIIFWDSKDFVDYCIKSGADGCVATFEADSLDHSYARKENGLVVQIAEKLVISNEALCGVHYWKRTDYAFTSFRLALDGKPHFNNDYYIAPTYNELIELGYEIRTYKTDGMVVLGTPDKLKEYVVYRERM